MHLNGLDRPIVYLYSIPYEFKEVIFYLTTFEEHPLSMSEIYMCS